MKVPTETSEEAIQKPTLRGVLHQYGFFVALFLNGFLLLQTQEAKEFYAILIYSIGLNSLLGSSALYHRINWSPQVRPLMRRLDHTMIFVLIAATYTPFGMLAFDSPKNTFVLYALWSAVFVGFLVKLLWITAPKWLAASLYIAAGWLVIGR